jgi:hypothetical protein
MGEPNLRKETDWDKPPSKKIGEMYDALAALEQAEIELLLKEADDE